MKAVVIAFLAMLLAVQANAEQCSWPEWEHFAANYIDDDGKVVDGSDERQITTSEGQSYAMFFALVAGDKQRFQQLLDWTSANLVDGSLATQLPAWLWGQGEKEKGIIDANAASDADLWIAYSLAEAGRLWSNHEYRTLSFYLAKLIERKETAQTESYGAVLLPAPYGFVMDDGDVRLNPSYLAPQLLRRMATLYPGSSWPEIERSAYKLLIDSAPDGYSPDWFRLSGSRIMPDPSKGYVGSYDAIRVYLWIGMLHKDSPHRDNLVQHFSMMAALTDVLGTPPETVDIATSTWQGDGPYGFSAAMIPLLRQTDMGAAAAKQKARVVKAMQSASGRDSYYNTVLSLFAMGWEQGRYKFGPEGQLEVLKGGCE